MRISRLKSLFNRLHLAIYAQRTNVFKNSAFEFGANMMRQNGLGKSYLLSCMIYKLLEYAFAFV